jgi:hypothetical protein
MVPSRIRTEGRVDVILNAVDADDKDVELSCRFAFGHDIRRCARKSGNKSRKMTKAANHNFRNAAILRGARRELSELTTKKFQASAHETVA